MSQFENAGPLQTEILCMMWEPAHKDKQWTVSDVHALINKRREGLNERPLAYTTFLTVLRNLSRRGFMNQTNTGQRAHVFTPKMERVDYERSLFSFLTRTLYANDSNKLSAAVIAFRDDTLQNNGG